MEVEETRGKKRGDQPLELPLLSKGGSILLDDPKEKK